MIAARGFWLSAALLLGCNGILGLEEPSTRSDGAGGAGGDGGSGAGLVGGQGGDGAAATSGGANTGGMGGDGAGGCPPEHPTTGTELLDNGSFELGMTSWVATSALLFQTDRPGVCGCTAARVTQPAGYSELRHLGLAQTQVGDVTAYARVKAPDTEYLELIVRVDATNLTPLTFASDASDGVSDGWRTAQGTFPIPTAGLDIYIAVAFEPDQQADFEVDCVSLTHTP